MRAIVRRYRLQVGDRFVIEPRMILSVPSWVDGHERVSAPIVEVSKNGQRCLLQDGTVITGEKAVYIERSDGQLPVEVTQALTNLPTPEREVEL